MLFQMVQEWFVAAFQAKPFRLIFSEDVAVPGSLAKSRIVQLQTADGSRQRVDLGPVNELDSFKLKTGDPISVTGHSGQTEAGTLLIADELRAKNQMVEIHRPWIPRGVLPPPSPGQPWY